MDLNKHSMLHSSIALYNWNNGVIMISVFAAVCIVLVIMLILFMSSGKKKGDQEDL